MALGHRITVIVVLVLALASWIVALAGISTMTRDCYSNYNGNGNYDGAKFFAAGYFGNMNCERGLQYQWWGVWFEFIVLVIILGYAFTNTMALHQSTLQALLAVTTAVNMWIARQWMDKNPANYLYAIGGRQSGRNVAAAGWIMFLVFNFFLIFLLGSGFVWFGETDQLSGGGGGGGAYGSKGGAAQNARPAGPNFAAPATFASPLSGGGARAYLPNSPGGEPTVSAVREV